jgi:hypothetical protein
MSSRHLNICSNWRSVSSKPKLRFSILFIKQPVSVYDICVHLLCKRVGSIPPLFRSNYFQKESTPFKNLLLFMNTALYPRKESTLCRVSSKQTKINFGSNRNKPKQDLFRVCFGLFRETKNKTFRFVSVFRTNIETTETNRSVSHKTETNRNNPKFSEKYPNILSFKLFVWVFCFETNRKKRKKQKNRKKIGKT